MSEEIIEAEIVETSLTVYDPNPDAWLGFGFGRMPTTAEGKNKRDERLAKAKQEREAEQRRIYEAYEASFDTPEESEQFYRENFVNWNAPRRESSRAGWTGMGVLFALMALILWAAYALVN